MIISSAIFLPEINEEPMGMGLNKREKIAVKTKRRYTQSNSTMYTKTGDIIQRYSLHLTHQSATVDDTIH